MDLRKAVIIARSSKPPKNGECWEAIKVILDAYDTLCAQEQIFHDECDRLRDVATQATKNLRAARAEI